MSKRIIVAIDEARCNGCGKCVIACRQGVIRIVDGKAKVVRESSCDGLGACIGECPQKAISIREAAPAGQACGCPGARSMDLRQAQHTGAVATPSTGSQLQNWPIQLRLVNPRADFFKGAHLLVAADCAGFAHPRFHEAFLKNRILINFCPKLDEALDEYAQKLTAIFKRGDIRSVTIAHMEVPCCFGLAAIVKDALKAAGLDIPLEEVTIAIRG